MNIHTLRGEKIWGAEIERREMLQVAGAMLLVTIVYQGISAYVLTDFQFNWFETIGTWSGLVTVWLARTENVLCWPWGLVSALALGYFFGLIGLPGQQWLNWVYFFFIQVWAWSYWVAGSKSTTTLPVTRLTGVERGMYAIGLLLLTVVAYNLIDVFVPGSTYPVLDAVVVAASLIAQYLLGRKNIESWYLWLGPVNVLSVALFYMAGAYTVMALYVAFLIHAVFALKSWHASMSRTSNSHQYV
jgi:nicotinamide mononucleotide transporter